MKQYNLDDLVGSIKSSLLSYMCSSLPVGNHSSQRWLGEKFYKRWEETTFKGPFLETIPQYRKTVSLSQKFSPSAILSESEQRFRDLIRPKYAAEEFTDRLARSGVPGRVQIACKDDELRKLWDRSLYEHQLKAFEIVTSGCNLAVATGTGSGKTECFLLPLLYSLLTEPDETRKKLGVRALLLYPMNALVEDQIRRLRALLCWINGQSKLASGTESRLTRPITFGRYVGSTRLDERDKSQDRHDPDGHIHELGEMLHRNEMQKSPPDILITNFSMLEYILLRNDDKRLFASPELFRFLVLDEIHSYRGTQGMEVACLLRRFDDLLLRNANGQTVSYQRIGLSATLPSDPASRKLLVGFVSDLFSTEIPDGCVIVEPEKPGGVEVGTGDWPQLARDLIELPETTPNLWKRFGLGGHTDEEPDDIPSEEWGLVAEALQSSTAPSENDLEQIEKLGRILRRSPAVKALGLLAQQRKVTLANEVALGLFGDHADASQREKALGILLQLVCAGRVEGGGLLPLRVHFFVKEQREAQLCISPSHPKEEPTDGWWKAVYMVHHATCDACHALVFPMMLCRRCGFVSLEAWFRNGHYFPEPDGLMPERSFIRVLFRPLASIPDYLLDKFKAEPPEGTQVREFTICLSCGLRIVTAPTGEAAATTHACGKAQLVHVLEWSSPDSNVRISRCPHCDQQYYHGQEVVTPPMLSPYGAATVLLEEIKRALDAPLKDRINKVLCFSDSRQQAAKIARRLGRTNEDFVFRQLCYQALRQAGEQRLSTRQLVEVIIERLRDDIGLAELFCERGESPRDTRLLRERISTMLFRELCTEFQTMERLGLVQVEYPHRFLDLGLHAVATHWLGKMLTPPEQEALLRAYIDWAFRLNRWAVTAPTLPIDHKELMDRYGYRDKTVALWSGGQGAPMGFCMKKSDPRSRRLNFYFRVCKRFSVLQSVSDLEGFNRLAEKMWTQAVASPNLLSRQGDRGGPDPEKPFVIVSGNEPEQFSLKLNFEAFTWVLGDPENELYRCNYCQYVSSFNVRDICPVRDCGGKLNRVSLSEIIRERFSPTGHYVQLVTERQPKPIWVEEHTAQLSQKRRAQIEADFRDDGAGKLDVISGSTTFELGVDLGEINSILLANLPPEISNYRQRAGRAGRRPGMLPFILGYVRERPHDKYFWSDLEGFIAGPLRVPWLAKPSREIVLRHANAIIFAYLLELRGQSSELRGPLCPDFVSFCLDTIQKAKVKAAAGTGTLSQSLKSLLAIHPALRLTPQECVDQFFKVVAFHNGRNFANRAKDHSIDVFGDYGILPSYSFPIYVDELVLYQKPLSEPPRCDLKLQRDRRIALREYFPGRLIEADKWVLESVGIREGFDKRNITVCPKCGRVYSGSHEGPCLTTGCAGQCAQLQAVIPWGGFLGQVPPKPPPLDSELFELQVSEVVFDPATDPEPTLETRGRFLLAAHQTASDMTNARMRMFSPRPTNLKGLQLVESSETDSADPARKPMRCLMLPGKGTDAGQALPRHMNPPYIAW